ncbi:MAG: helix-turn-helix transcriptional regulator [Selenomonadales bacterium]|nr:helix-turn-helix transcriptional regulator [Selenomonadales bacterium]
MRVEIDKKVVGKNLTKLVKNSGKSRKEICAATGIGYSTFTEWINGRKYPRPEGIEILAKYFGVSKADLIEEQTAAPVLLSPAEIGNTIRAQREEKGLTYEQLAEQTGTTVAVIKKWEKGKIAEPRIDMASNLARALDLPTSALFGVQENETNIRRQRFRTMLYEELPDLCLTDDEIRQVINYIKFVISQRK